MRKYTCVEIESEWYVTIDGETDRIVFVSKEKNSAQLVCRKLNEAYAAGVKDTKINIRAAIGC